MLNDTLITRILKLCLKIYFLRSSHYRILNKSKGTFFVLSVNRDLFRTMRTCDAVEGRLRSRADRFRHRLTDKFMWDFNHLDEEEEDEAPVVVVL